MDWGPKLYGNNMFYSSAPNGYGEIYKYDLTTQSNIRVLGGDGIDRSSLAIWGDNLVTDRYVSGQSDLYIYDPIGGERPISIAPGHQNHPDIYQETVVYEDHSGPVSRVMLWEESTGLSTPVAESSYAQTSPKIWNDRVIWQEGRAVYSHTPSEGTMWIGNADYSAVYGDRVIMWEDDWWEYPGHGSPGIHHQGTLGEWTPTTGQHYILIHDKKTYWLDMWGDLIVGSNIAWDPAHGFTYHGVNPSSVYGSQVVGTKSDSNIYLEAMIPEPSGLVGMVSMLALFGTLVRKRRTQ